MKILEKAKPKMEAKLYVGNLSKSTTQDELNTLFAQAGEVTSAEVIKDRKSGEPRGFAFVTMSAQSEADKAVSMFDSYSLSDHTLKVSLAKPREQRGVTIPHIEL
jgi:RNA recognition motif-containing protein